jgi:hypothetical protein
VVAPERNRRLQARFDGAFTTFVGRFLVDLHAGRVSARAADLDLPTARRDAGPMLTVHELAKGPTSSQRSHPWSRDATLSAAEASVDQISRAGATLRTDQPACPAPPIDRAWQWMTRTSMAHWWRAYSAFSADTDWISTASSERVRLPR